MMANDVAEEAPPTLRARCDLAALAWGGEATVVMPSSLLLALRAESACEEPARSSVRVVEIDPDEVSSGADEMEEGVPSRDFLDDPHEIVGDDDELDAEIELAFDSLPLP